VNGRLLYLRLILFSGGSHFSLILSSSFRNGTKIKHTSILVPESPSNPQPSRMVQASPPSLAYYLAHTAGRSWTPCGSQIYIRPLSPIPICRIIHASGSQFHCCVDSRPCSKGIMKFSALTSSLRLHTLPSAARFHHPRYQLRVHNP